MSQALSEATELRNEEKSDNEKTIADAEAGENAVREAISILQNYCTCQTSVGSPLSSLCSSYLFVCWNAQSHCATRSYFLTNSNGFQPYFNDEITLSHDSSTDGFLQTGSKKAISLHRQPSRGADSEGNTVGDLAPETFDEEYRGAQEESKGIATLKPENETQNNFLRVAHSLRCAISRPMSFGVSCGYAVRLPRL